MQNIYTETVTLTTGTNAQLAGASKPRRCCRIFVEPDAANANDAYIGGPAFAPGTSLVDGLIKKLAKPSAATAAILDNWDNTDQSGGNLIDPMSYNFVGTTGQKVRVTLFTR